MSYMGSKVASGVYQKIIAQMPHILYASKLTLMAAL